MRARRTQLSAEQRETGAQRVADHLSDWLMERPERVIGVYLALPGELSLDVLLPLLWETGRTVVAPRVEVEAGRMRFWRLDSLDEVALGLWNVREPLGARVLLPEIVLVPGLAFDASGGRLGMGGGWYDRTLSAMPTGQRTVTVGVCFDAHIVPHVPCESHDARVDWVASDRRIVRTSAPAAF